MRRNQLCIVSEENNYNVLIERFIMTQSTIRKYIVFVAVGRRW